MEIKAQAAMLLTLVESDGKESVQARVLRGDSDDLNDTCTDMAEILVAVGNSPNPPFDDDPRIAALTAENEQLRKDNRRLVDRITELNSELNNAAEEPPCPK